MSFMLLFKEVFPKEVQGGGVPLNPERCPGLSVSVFQTVNTLPA
jgi:hypothetical protein